MIPKRLKLPYRLDALKLTKDLQDYNGNCNGCLLKTRFVIKLVTIVVCNLNIINFKDMLIGDANTGVKMYWKSKVR